TVTGGPVGAPAGDAHADVVLTDEVLGTGVLAEELGGRVLLDLELDSDAAQGLLEGLGSVDVALAGVADGDGGAEAVLLAALLELVLGGLEVTGVVLGGVQVQVGVGPGQVGQEQAGGDVAAHLAAPGAVQAVAVGRVHDGLSAGQVVDGRGVEVDV